MFYKRQADGRSIALLQFYYGHTAFTLAITAQTETLDHTAAPQMFMDRSTQRTGSIAVDQINYRLSVEQRPVNKRIHFRQRLVYGQTQQVAFHLGSALYPLHTAPGSAGISCQPRIALLLGAWVP